MERVIKGSKKAARRSMQEGTNEMSLEDEPFCADSFFDNNSNATVSTSTDYPIAADGSAEAVFCSLISIDELGEFYNQTHLEAALAGLVNSTVTDYVWGEITNAFDTDGDSVITKTEVSDVCAGNIF